MAGIRKSARVARVKLPCGHIAEVVLPPGELGVVGRRRIAAKRCSVCEGKKRRE